MQEIQITRNEAGQRLDKLLGKVLRKAPKSFFYKMLRKKNITLNGKKAEGMEKLSEGDVVRLFLSDETIGKFSENVNFPKVEKTEKKSKKKHKTSNTKLDIIYENEDILLINKKVGQLSQKAHPNDVSVVEYVTEYLLESGQLTQERLRTFRPSVCNRLDCNTSGILAAGKSLPGLQELSLFFKERTLEKYYWCPVIGEVKEAVHIRGFLLKDEKTNKVRVSKTEIPGSTAIETAYRPLKSSEGITLLEVHLITGKTHQIRAHLASVGHPIVGDYKYGNKKINETYRKDYGLKSQLLHARRLVMPQTQGVLSDVSGRVFEAELPELFERICRDKGVLI